MSSDLLIGLIVGLLPLAGGLIVWVARNQLGLFSRKVIWGTSYLLSDRVSADLGDNRKTHVTAGWRYIVIRVSRGPEPVRNLTIHFDGPLSEWSSQPKLVGALAAHDEKTSVLTFPSIESGRYQICVASLREYGGPPVAEAVTADNASCKSKGLAPMDFDAPPRALVALWAFSAAIWFVQILNFFLAKGGTPS
jgi:hypothetical protein